MRMSDVIRGVEGEEGSFKYAVGFAHVIGEGLSKGQPMPAQEAVDALQFHLRFCGDERQVLNYDILAAREELEFRSGWGQVSACKKVWADLTESEQVCLACTRNHGSMRAHAPPPHPPLPPPCHPPATLPSS